MSHYKVSDKIIWSGRTSGEQLYLHQKVQCIGVDQLSEANEGFALLGYACDEGVRRNQGRIGAQEGPEAIRKALGKMPNHLPEIKGLFDVGDVYCNDKQMELAQAALSEMVVKILQNNALPVLLGGGHDIAYGHYDGLKKFLISKDERPSIGIINFDAHFDLRNDEKGANSGTPFYQIGNENDPFNYLCLGIRKDANDKVLFKTASEFKVTYVLQHTFRMAYMNEIKTWIKAFMQEVNYVYVTIDLDGFSSAFAPGTSAASPMGFSPDIVLECLQTIIESGKLLSFDIAEMNPAFDRDGQTAKLAASLIHHVIHAEFP